MRVVVVGVTGRIGKRVARLLVERGHEVVGLNRRAARQPVVLGDLRIRTLQADSADRAAMTAAFQDADCIVFATVPTREHPEQFLDQIHSVVDAARACAVPRVLFLTHFKALTAPDGRPMLEAQPANPYFRALEETFVEQRDLIATVRDVDWVLVAPAADVSPYGPATGQWRESVERLIVTDESSLAFEETSRISMQDLADFCVREIENPRYSRQLVTVGY